MFLPLCNILQISIVFITYFLAWNSALYKYMDVRVWICLKRVIIILIKLLYMTTARADPRLSVPHGAQAARPGEVEQNTVSVLYVK